MCGRGTCCTWCPTGMRRRCRCTWCTRMRGFIRRGCGCFWKRCGGRCRLWAAAGVLMLTFVLLRSGNVYGDPGPWSAQGRGWMADLMSFARVHKYPPSLQYLLVTGSIGLALLALFERVNATSGVLRKPAQWLL
eukprot:gene30048-37200_t